MSDAHADLSITESATNPIDLAEEALPMSVTDTADTADLSVILDIPVTVALEVGKAELSINELLSLKQDAIIELDRKVGEPLDVRVNGRLIARGEVVEVNGQYGVRLSQVVKQPDAGLKLN